MLGFRGIQQRAVLPALEKFTAPAQGHLPVVGVGKSKIVLDPSQSRKDRLNRNTAYSREEGPKSTLCGGDPASAREEEVEGGKWAPQAQGGAHPGLPLGTPPVCSPAYAGALS